MTKDELEKLVNTMAEEIAALKEEKQGGPVGPVNVNDPEELTREQLNEAEKAAHEMVNIKLFKNGEQYREPLFVRVGGVPYLIKRGVLVAVPKCVADIVAQQEEQDVYVANLSDELEENFAKESENR